MSFQVDIKSGDSLSREVLEVPGTLQVVELYNEWSGPCKAVQSTFKRIYFDAGDRPLKFFTLNVDKVPGMEEYRGHCIPTFLFYKDSQVIEKVAGVNVPVLEKLIKTLSEKPVAAA